MKITTPELDELMRNADGDEGDVRDALFEVGGARPTLDAQVIYRTPRAPNQRNATEMAGGAPPGKRHWTIRKSTAATSKSDAPNVPNNRGPRIEDRGPSSGSAGGAAHARRVIRTRNFTIRSPALLPVRL